MTNKILNNEIPEIKLQDPDISRLKVDFCLLKLDAQVNKEKRINMVDQSKHFSNLNDNLLALIDKLLVLLDYIDK